MFGMMGATRSWETSKMQRQFRATVKGILLLFCAVVCAANPPRIVTTPQTAQLTGTVVDFYGLQILGAVVTVEGNNKVWSEKTNENGTYTIDLPAGQYKVTVTAGGFCRMTRAPFVLESSTKIAMNFALYHPGLAESLMLENGRKFDGSDMCGLPFKEEVFPVNSPRSPLNLHVQFAEKSETGSVIHYKGIAYSQTRQIGLVLTYDLMEIHADSVDLNKNTFKLEASGNVVVDTGTGQLRASHVSIDLKTGPRIISSTN